MLRTIFNYLLPVLIFGSVMGWSNSLNSEFSQAYHFITAYVIMALIWGSIFSYSIIDKISTTNRTKLLITVGVALSAGAIAYLYLSKFGQGEVTQNTLAGWGEDRSVYKEYPIKGYELVGSVIFFMYIFLGTFHLIEGKQKLR